MAPGRPPSGPPGAPPPGAPPPGYGQPPGGAPPGYPPSGGAPPPGGQYPTYPQPGPGAYAPGYATGLKPHRGTLILVLGICGFAVCMICGIIAWVMANNDLREMKAGVMDSSGYQLTNAGRICGMISVLLTVLALLFFIVIFAIGFQAAGSTV